MPDQASKLRYRTIVLLLGFAALLAFAGLEALPRAGADPWTSESRSPQWASSIFSHSSSNSSTQRCMPSDPVRAVRLGDTVEIRVFETLDPEEEGGPATRYERRDLSATAVVDAAGEIAFGSFGRLTVAGVLPLCIEQEISARIAKMMGIKVSALATFASRATITVGGTVATPGTYHYTAGLTVHRLLAMSGGSGESQADQRRRQVLEAREAELLLQRSRLEAELTYVDTWQSPAHLRKAMERAMGLELAKERIAGAHALFESARALRVAASALDEAERDALVAARDLALLQENAMREGLDEATVRRDSLAEDLSDDCRGRCSNARLTKEIRLDSLGNRELDLKVALQDRVRLRSIAEAALQIFDRTQKAREVARASTILDDIGRNWETAMAVRADLAALRGGGRVPELTIERLEVGGSLVFVAEPETAILPGDFLHVGQGGPKPRIDRIATLSQVTLAEETGNAVSN